MVLYSGFWASQKCAAYKRDPYDFVYLTCKGGKYQNNLIAYCLNLEVAFCSCNQHTAMWGHDNSNVIIAFSHGTLFTVWICERWLVGLSFKQTKPMFTLSVTHWNKSVEYFETISRIMCHVTHVHKYMRQTKGGPTYRKCSIVLPGV